MTIYGLFKVIKDSIYNIKIIFEDINKNKSIVSLVLVAENEK